MPTLFEEGERVIVDFGIGDPQSGEIIAAADDGRSVTVRLDAGIMGYGDLPPNTSYWPAAARFWGS
jgi:hypothetical protein